MVSDETWPWASRPTRIRFLSGTVKTLILACVVLLIGCGFIEGYISPNPEFPLWTRIIVGVGYWLFGVHNPATHLLMTATVVTIIMSILVLLFELQYPFRSNVGIGPEIWQKALDHMHLMQKGEMKDMRM